jgi:hypothetical protein
MNGKMMRQFLAKYNLPTHSIAFGITLAITTFGTSQDFRDGCIQIWKAVNAELAPHPILYLATFKLGFPLAVALWGWYRNGQRKTTLDASISPASGRTIIDADSKIITGPTSEKNISQ